MFAGFVALSKQQSLEQIGPQDSMHYHTGLCKLCHGSSISEFFSFSVESSTSTTCWCYGVCFLYSDSDGVKVYKVGIQFFGFASLQPFGIYQWQAYLPAGIVSCSIHKCTE